MRLERLALPQLLSVHQVADLYRSQGLYAEADDLLASQPAGPTTDLARARCAIALGKNERARDLLAGVLASGEHTIDAQLLLARAALDHHDIDAALDHLDLLPSPPAAFRQLYLTSLDATLTRRFDNRVTALDPRGIDVAARRLSASWRRFLDRWHIDLAGLDRHLVPMGLRQRCRILAGILMWNRLDESFAPLHPFLTKRSLVDREKPPAAPFYHPPVRLPIGLPPIVMTQTAKREAATAPVLDTSLDHAATIDLRLATNAALLDAVMADDSTQRDRMLARAQTMVLRGGQLADEIIFPALVLAACDQRCRAVDHLAMMIGRYPATYARRWLAAFTAIVDGRRPSPPETGYDDLPDIYPSQLDLLYAALWGDRAAIASAYHHAQLTRHSHWHELRAWHLERAAESLNGNR